MNTHHEKPSMSPLASTISFVPPLSFKHRSFLCFLSTQALGAFNDNVFKQLVLLLGVGYLIAGVEFQAIVQFLFAITFLLFSGLAGDLADRYSKGRLMTLCKVAEIFIAIAGVSVFVMASDSSSNSNEAPLYLWMLAIIIFALGTQSAFFGPPKYGGLPELVRGEDLAPATGLTQMTTFLSIILGVAVAGLLADLFADKLYAAGLVTVTIAILGTITSLGIARQPPADPKRKVSLRSFVSVVPTLMYILRDDPLMFRIMLIYSWFWFVGGVALTAINVVGRLQLGLNNFETSMMVSITSIGIAVGSVIAGKLSQGKVRLGLILPGLVVLIVCLIAFFVVPLHSPTADDLKLLNQIKNASAEAQNGTQIIPLASTPIYATVGTLLFCLGTASGFFSVPLLTFIQARPLDKDKGKVFAAVNWLNWVFIVASALFYGIGINLADNKANQLLGFLGILTFLVGIVMVPRIFTLLRQVKPEFVFLNPPN